MTQELEVKLAIDPQLIIDPLKNPITEFAADHWEIHKTHLRQQTDSLRDTNHLHIWNAGYVLRMRTHAQDQSVVQSLKEVSPSVHGLMDRQESEKAIWQRRHPHEPTIEQMCRNLAPRRAQICIPLPKDAPFSEIALIQTRRTFVDLHIGHQKAELAIDQGQIWIGHTAPIGFSQVKLEAKGHVDDYTTMIIMQGMYKLRAHIGRQFGYDMQPSASKGETAMRAAVQLRQQAQKVL